MAQLPETEHVVGLLGLVSTKTKVLRVVLSLCDCGPLDTYLKLKTGLGTGDKMQIIADVADGMAELEALGYVHSGLRTAGVLVAEGGSVFKVGCWGLQERDAKWMAPETLAGGGYTHQSDVWCGSAGAAAAAAPAHSPGPQVVCAGGAGRIQRRRGTRVPRLGLEARRRAVCKRVAPEAHSNVP